MSLSLVVLILVFLGVALRQVFRIPLKIWQIMGVGACLVLFTGRITLLSAWMAIDWDVIFFLFGMFVIGQALEESGYLSLFVARFLDTSCSQRKLIFIVVFGMGLASAILMNDTLAIMGTPLLLKVAKGRKTAAHPLLLALAFAITIGSVMSPIGNPQNLYLALVAPIHNPFFTFLVYLAIPTLINLTLVYFLALFLTRALKREKLGAIQEESIAYNKRLMLFCRIALILLGLMILNNIFASFIVIGTHIPLPWVALVPALFLLIFAPKRKEVFFKLDWHTILFFIAMFILMKSVWETSSIKDLLVKSPWMTSTIPGILSVSTIASQLISNVPLVALYLPTLQQFTPTTLEYMALAAGSTVAGNFLIFGAASNFIITQNAEKRGDKGISFFEFAKYGIPLTVMNLLVYWGYFAFLSQIM